MRKGSGSQLDKKYPREYNIWAMMKQRCNNPKAANYVNYGAKGVAVCARWGVFSAFLADMGPAPSSQHTLDRIDNTQGYSPENCRWADVETQQNNRTNGVHFNMHGKQMSSPQIARVGGMPISRMEHRLKQMGLTPEQALALPKQSWVQRPVYQKTLDGSRVWQHESLADASKFAQAQGWRRQPRWESQAYKRELPMSVDDCRKLLHEALKRSKPLWGFLWAYEAPEQCST
jgi:hypothetical protein